MTEVEFQRAVADDIHRMAERELSPPDPTPAELEHAERDDEQRMYVYAAAVGDVLAARGDFWPADGALVPEFDNEQFLPVFRACRDAVADDTLTDAQRWQLVFASILAEGAKYARAKAEGEI